MTDLSYLITSFRTLVSWNRWYASAWNNKQLNTHFPGLYFHIFSTSSRKPFVSFNIAPFAKKAEDVERYNVPGMCFRLLYQYQNEENKYRSNELLISLLPVAPDRFLPPSSPLTDIETIFGGNQAVAFHVRRFDKHVSEDLFDSWESLSWVHYEW